jgi:hypothetical protein
MLAQAVPSNWRSNGNWPKLRRHLSVNIVPPVADWKRAKASRWKQTPGESGDEKNNQTNKQQNYQTTECAGIPCIYSIQRCGRPPAPVRCSVFGAPPFVLLAFAPTSDDAAPSLYFISKSSSGK